jgi:hypothetical protein
MPAFGAVLGLSSHALFFEVIAEKTDQLFCGFSFVNLRVRGGERFCKLSHYRILSAPSRIIFWSNV